MPIILTCAHCGKSFSRRPGNVAHGRQFCSRPCKYAADRIPALETFWARVTIPDDPDTCWLWSGNIGRGGYGIFACNTNGKRTSKLAHRFSYRLHVGDIPAGLIVCHRCDVPRCVNPAHLFLGTHQDNTDDMVKKGRSPAGERSGLAKLTSNQVREIRRRFDAGEGRRKLAREYAVSRDTIRGIGRRKSWKSLPEEEPRG